MRKLSVCLMFVAAFALASGSAFAQINDWSAWWIRHDPLNLDASGWSFDDVESSWTVWEDYVAPIVDNSATGSSGEIDRSVPTVHIEKRVTNNSTFIWTEYHIEISGSEGVSYVPGSATSDTFLTIVEAGNLISFYAPDPLPIGETVIFNFDIELPPGQFSFEIWQMPVPEPASLLLLGVGALLIRRR